MASSDNVAAPRAVVSSPAARRRSGLPKLVLETELVAVVVGLGLLGALRFGGVISNSIHASTPWLVMACLTLPMALAAALFWALAHLFTRVVPRR